MSDFQNQVGMVAPAGAAGDSASTNPDIVVVNPISGAWKAAGGGVDVGKFVWADSNNNLVRTGGSGVPPLGFVIKDKQSSLSTGVKASMVIARGFSVTIVKKSDRYALLELGTAVVGAQVFANLTTGAIEATGGAGNVYTGWKFASAGLEGTTVKITGWV